MYTKLKQDNFKLTVMDDKINNEEYYFEIIVNRSFLNTLLLSLMLFKESMPKLDVKLTPREEEVLMHISRGEDNGVIAKYMNVSIHTAKIHIRNIFQKLGVKDRTQAVVKAVKYGLINIF